MEQPTSGIGTERVIQQYQQHDHYFRKLQKFYEKLVEKEQMVSLNGVVKLLRAYEAALESAVALQDINAEVLQLVEAEMSKKVEEEIVSETVEEEGDNFMDAEMIGHEEPALEGRASASASEEANTEEPDVDFTLEETAPLDVIGSSTTETIIPTGSEVAMLCKVEGESAQEDWILGHVVRYIPDDNSYEIEDAEGENGSPSKGGAKTHYTVHYKKVHLLSDTVDNSVKSKQQVLALFPGTTCLYPAVVISTPARRKKTKDFLVRFSDDEVPQRTVPSRYVLFLREK